MNHPDARTALGLLIAAYGALVLVGVMPHDAPAAGLLALAAGSLLLLPSLLRPAPPAEDRPSGRLPLAVSALGLCLAAGPLAYNALAASSVSLPEWAIVAYGAALVISSRHLHRAVGPVRVATCVAWSFPLVLAPLALFALNAMLSAGTGETAASPVVQLLIVHPTALLLQATGTPVDLQGSTMHVPTPRGQLSLGVGLVCAGLYPMVLFLAFLAMHSWTEKVSPRRAFALALAGVAGLWLMNVVRLVVLTKVGRVWGPAILQSAHANLGWVLFGLFMAAFWWMAMRPRAVPTR